MYLIELGHIIQKLFYYLFKIIFLFYDYEAQRQQIFIPHRVVRPYYTKIIL